jgi:hypothetical protein
MISMIYNIALSLKILSDLFIEYQLIYYDKKDSEKNNYLVFFFVIIRSS